MSPLSYAASIHQLCQKHQAELQSQHTAQFTLPVGLLNYIVLIAFLLCGHNRCLIFKALTFLTIVGLSAWTLSTSRTLGLAYGVIVGISSSLCCATSFNLIFVHDSVQFQRLISQQRNAEHEVLKEDVNDAGYHWQGMPDNTLERPFWTLDLLGSLCGRHWRLDTSRSFRDVTKRRQRKKHETSLIENIGKLLLIYICIDILKEIIALDPYFWGLIDHKAPNHIQVSLQFKFLIQIYRLLICSITIYISIHLLATTGTLIFCNALGPTIAGTWGHEWSHGPQFGDFDTIFKRGLRGFWGGWWHQIFRTTLATPANAIVDVLRCTKGGMMARIIRLVVPFVISGVIHACGSYTMPGPSIPLNTFVFFASQPFGIAVQAVLVWVIEKIPSTGTRYRSVILATNLLTTALWLFLTFPLMADDFARGGMWLTEPFPLSVLQLVGLGSEARAKGLGYSCDDPLRK